MKQSVSFVVPACNEAAYVGGAVETIRAAADQFAGEVNHEIVVVDDGSMDGTAQIAARHGAVVVGIDAHNIAAARNAGAAATTGTLLVFVDADTRPSHELVCETFTAARQGLIWGTALATLWDAHPWWVRIALPLFNWYYVRRRRCAYGFYFVVNREAFEQAGGFSIETSEGEDMALSKELLVEYGPPHVFQSRVATSARKADDFGLVYHLKMACLGISHGDAMYVHPSIADYRDGSLRVPPRE